MCFEKYILTLVGKLKKVTEEKEWKRKIKGRGLKEHLILMKYESL